MDDVDNFAVKEFGLELSGKFRTFIKKYKTGHDPPRTPTAPLDSLPPVREGLCAPPELEDTAVRKL